MRRLWRVARFTAMLSAISGLMGWSVVAGAVFAAIALPGLCVLIACERLVGESRRAPRPPGRPEPERAAVYLMRLAVRRTPPAVRAELYGEWSAELYEILHGPDARPYWRVYHATRYTLGLVRAAPHLARVTSAPALTGVPLVPRKPEVVPPSTGWDVFFEAAYGFLGVIAFVIAVGQYFWWPLSLSAGLEAVFRAHRERNEWRARGGR